MSWTGLTVSCTRCGATHLRTKDRFPQADSLECRSCFRARARALYRKHVAVRLAKVAAYQRARPGYASAKAAAWNARHPERKASYTAARNHRLRASGGLSPSDIRAIRAMSGERCGYCLSKILGTGHLDHVVPISGGGANDASNVVQACAGCNMRKGSVGILDFVFQWRAA